MILTQCKHDPTPDIIPEMTFKSEEGYIFSDTTLQVEEEFSIEVVASSNELSKRNLNRFTITHKINGVGLVVVDSIINTTTFTYTNNYTTSGDVGDEEYIFTITDEKGKTRESVLVISKISLKPQLEFIVDSGYVSGNVSLQQNKFFRVGVNANISPTTNAKLTRLLIRRKFGSLIITEVDSTLGNVDSYSGSWYFNANEMEGSEEWWFIVYDENNENKLIELTMITDAPQTPMDEAHSVSIHNGIGALDYGWDLWGDFPVTWSSEDENKDMVNDTNYVHLLPPFYFKEMFKSENGTKFVQANFYDFENATLEDAADIFTGATLTNVKTYVVNFAEEDIYISKLRGEEKYVAIKITNIELTVDDDDDRIDFEYKKVAD